jgi:hypothetical protein
VTAFVYMILMIAFRARLELGSLVDTCGWLHLKDISLPKLLLRVAVLSEICLTLVLLIEP